MALIDGLNPYQRRALENVRAAAERIWRAPLHRYYTDHTVAHSERVIALLDGLAAGMMQTDRRLAPGETLVLLAAAYLHDVGMQDERFAGGDLEAIRAAHHEVTAEWIYRTLETPGSVVDLGLPDDPGLVEAVALVAKAHRKVDLHAADYDPFPHGGETMRPRLLGALLRLGDELDIDHRRVDLELMKVMNPPLESQLHWWKCHYVSGVSIVDETIQITYRFPHSHPDYEGVIVPLVETEVRQKLADLEEILRAHAVKVALGRSQVRLMRAVNPMSEALEELFTRGGREELEPVEDGSNRDRVIESLILQIGLDDFVANIACWNRQHDLELDLTHRQSRGAVWSTENCLITAFSVSKMTTRVELEVYGWRQNAEKHLWPRLHPDPGAQAAWHQLCRLLDRNLIPFQSSLDDVEKATRTLANLPVRYPPEDIDQWKEEHERKYRQRTAEQATREWVALLRDVEPSSPTFDQRGQHVEQQTNVAGDYVDRRTGGSQYHIHIERAEGIDISDGARVEPPRVDIVGDGNVVGDHSSARVSKTGAPGAAARAGGWDTAAIRDLVSAAFSDGELTTLCFDHFHTVYEEFGTGMAKGQKIQLLLDHCVRHGRLDELVQRVKERNPAQYARFEDRLGE